MKKEVVIVTGAALALLLAAASVYPHRLRRVPVVNALPWTAMLGNTALIPEYRPVAQHDADIAQARLDNPKIILLGDSLTNDWRTTGKLVWDAQIAPLNAAHLGVGQETTQRLLYRLQSGELQGLTPETVVLLIGTNNIGRNTSAEIGEAVALIVRELEAQFPTARIVVFGIFPRAASGDYEGCVQEINAQLAQIPGVTFVDMSESFLLDGQLNRSMYIDGVHLSEAGYHEWAQAIRRVTR